MKVISIAIYWSKMFYFIFGLVSALAEVEAQGQKRWGGRKKTLEKICNGRGQTLKSIKSVKITLTDTIMII